MVTTWAALFERAATHGTTVADVWAALRARRAARRGSDGRAGEPEATERPEGDDPGRSKGADAGGGDRDPDPTRVVADADVLAADLLVGGASRAALDHLREHGWTTLVASDPLVDDAAAIVRDLGNDGLAREWRARIDDWREPVTHPPGDHPALASALRGGAMHVLSLDEDLLSADAGVAVRGRVETSVRHPDAFARLFDPASLHAHAVGGSYPGPDRDPRA